MEPADAPVFVAPFEGEHNVSGGFDHGADRPGQQRLFTGGLGFGRSGHRAWDFGMPIGTPVFAMADGRVVEAGDRGPRRCGGREVASDVLVRVAHEDRVDGHDYVTVLAHLSEVRVAVGDEVVAGQLVGLSGTTGCSSGPHLHMAVFRSDGHPPGPPIDPYGWIGEGDDPIGTTSGRLWVPGREPPLRRRAARPPLPGVPTPVRLVGTDLLDPVGGELVELALGPDAPGPVSLAGYTLSDLGGIALVLPDRTLAPGESVVVRTGSAGPGELSFGRAEPVWDDTGDCAILRDPAGVRVSWLPFGPSDDPACPRASRKGSLDDEEDE